MSVYKSGRKVGGFVILILILIACILGGLLYLRETYTVQTVYVEGNVHYTEEEIRSIVMDGPLGDNSLYLSLKYKQKGVENIPFVDVMDVRILAPDTIKITVYEKALTGCIKYMDTYMYFDKDGYLVENSGIRTEGVPQITGLSFDYMVLGEQLPVQNEEIFEQILNITKLLSKYHLTTDKIHFQESGEITLYFDRIKVMLGKDSDSLEDKFMRLPEFLDNLQGKSGILQMDSAESNGKYTFKPD